LIFDEIQTGMGRTGTLFAYEQTGVTPDIMTLAKGLGNGLPIGAMLTRNEIAAALTAGSHASTFGGNPVAAAAAVATLKTLLAPGFLEAAQAKGRYLNEQLQLLATRFPLLASRARGMGLLQGLLLTEAGAEHGSDIVNGMFARGFLINFAGLVALRFAPPLIVSNEEIDLMMSALSEVLATFSEEI
jgi:acetylornithine aminotransferase/acetylornithine/N-succinyldiaminopimelate aminotransferase